MGAYKTPGLFMSRSPGKAPRDRDHRFAALVHVESHRIRLACRLRQKQRYTKGDICDIQPDLPKP